MRVRTIRWTGRLAMLSAPGSLLLALSGVVFLAEAFAESPAPPPLKIGKGNMAQVFEGTFRGMESGGTVTVDVEIHSPPLPPVGRVKCVVNHRTHGIKAMGLEVPREIPETALSDNHFWIHNLLKNNSVLRDINGRKGSRVEVAPAERYCLSLRFIENGNATSSSARAGQRNSTGEPAWKSRQPTRTRDEYLGQVRREIHSSVRYPASARRNGQEGLVRLKITIAQGGKLEHVELLESSGHPDIDRDALRSVMRAAPFGKFPEEIAQDSLTLVLPIAYRLTAPESRGGRRDQNSGRAQAAAPRGSISAATLPPISSELAGKHSKSDQLIRAVSARNDAQALALLKQGADPDARERSKGVPALYLAAQNRRLAVVEALLVAGAEVDASPATRPGTTALGVAAQRGDQRIVQALLASGAKVDAAGRDGVTPLLLAAQYGHTDVVEQLLNAGAAVNRQRRRDGVSALAFAAERGYEPMVRILIARGASVDLGDSQGRTALHQAVRKSRHAIAQALLDARADVDAQTRRSKVRPLHGAAYKKDAKMVRILLAAGAEPNARAIRGVTPLHVAAGGGALAVARELVGVADLDAKANAETPLDVARKRRDAAMIKLLTQAAAGNRR